MTWIFLWGEKRWVHAHTGVKTHLIGPRDWRMVARVRVGAPAQARARVERERGAAASESVEREGEKGSAPGVPCKKIVPKRKNERSGMHRANTPVWCRTRFIHHHHIYSIDTVQVRYRYLQVDYCIDTH